MNGEPGKADRLFRAAVSAFCSLTRPSRNEIAQLEDLALPLFDSVSVESRRFVAAALSECTHAPTALVQRLCDEPVDIAAPLLIRSNALNDVDLIALIGHHGLPHARAIARRPGLNPVIANLIKALVNSGVNSGVQREETAVEIDPPLTASNDGGPVQASAAMPSESETVRRRLRAMMRPAADSGADRDTLADSKPVDFSKLLSAALAGDPPSFQAMLADALGIDSRLAQSIAGSTDKLSTALRALDLREEQAFLLTAALFPASFQHTESIRQFLQKYRLCPREAARDKLRGWVARDGIADQLRIS